MSAPSTPQLVFEGPDPERLLLEAWSVHGTQVRITEPVIVRRGGIGGFFAKEHYRIEVLPSAPDTSPGAPGPAPAAAHLGPPAVAAPTPPPAVAPGGGLPLEQPTAPATPGGPGPATSWALAELVASTEDEVNLHSAPQPSFEEILGKVAGSLGDDPVAFAGHLPVDPLAAPAAPANLLQLLDGTAASLAGPAVPTAPVVAGPITAATPVVPPAADPVTTATPVVPAAADPVTTATPVVPPAAHPGEATAAEPDHLSSAVLDRPVVRARPWTLADAALDAAEATAPEAATANAEPAEAPAAALPPGEDETALAGTAAELTLVGDAPEPPPVPRGRHARRVDPRELDDPPIVAAEEVPRGRHAKRGDAAQVPAEASARRPRHARRDATEVVTATTDGSASATSGDEEVVTQLSQVGFPERLLAGTTSAPRTLGAAFELAPVAAPLPSEPGSLVAVVGSPSLARAVAELVGLAPSEVARARRGRAGGEVASHLLAQDSETAAELAATWRRGRVGVVAVAVGSPFEDGAWAASMLRAMRPSMTLAATSAIMKADDVQAFCDLLGGVDALVVEDLEATLSPASALATGIPVAMLEERTASAHTWTEVATRALARRSAAGA